MFLSRQYRARAIGLVAGYAVVIAALVINGVFDPRPTDSASAVTHPTRDFRPAPGIDSRCDPVC
jgi:hypothetical protein